MSFSFFILICILIIIYFLTFNLTLLAIGLGIGFFIMSFGSNSTSEKFYPDYESIRYKQAIDQYENNPSEDNLFAIEELKRIYNKNL